jgi:hypothetical protein
MELKGYTNIPDWMLSLDLDVYETIILAVIYGFSQDGESTFAGSLKYLCQKAKCSRRKVTMVLPKLVEKGLIIKIDKEVRGVHLCEYRVSPLCMGGASDAPGGGACHAPKNIENENIDIDSLYKRGSSHFQKPSLDDIRAYCISRGNNVDPEQFLNFYESKGWMVGKTPMRDWRAAIRTWEKRQNDSPRRRSPMTRSESVLEHNLKVMDQMFGTDLHSQAYGNRGGQADEQ